MPESLLHDEVVALVKDVLTLWAARADGSPRVARNLAVRWDEEHPAFGVDPDVCVLSPAPADPRLRSLRTWREGMSPPILAIEVVSETNPRKDYAVAPDKYAASGTRELLIFDPLLSGPASHGGPVRMQLWRRDQDGQFTRLYAGEGPVHSPTLAAYFVAVEDGAKLRIASDAAGTDLWRTPEEAERAAKEAALARVAELEAELAQRGA